MPHSRNKAFKHHSPLQKPVSQPCLCPGTAQPAEPWWMMKDMSANSGIKGQIT
jgi:hypothetical protein